MARYWRCGEGRKVIEITARWVVQEAAFRGLTVHDYIEGQCSLTDMGITSENAAAMFETHVLEFPVMGSAALDDQRLKPRPPHRSVTSGAPFNGIPGHMRMSE